MSKINYTQILYDKATRIMKIVGITKFARHRLIKK